MAEKERQPDREDTDILADLEQLSQESGFIYSFSLLVGRCLWMSTDEVADINWTERPNQEELSLLLGLLVKHPIRLDEIPSREAILEQAQRATELLKELHTFLSSPMLPSNSRDADAPDQLTDLLHKYENWMNSGKGMVEPIFYGGEGAYDSQFLEMASKKYEADEQWIQEHKGASIGTFIQVAKDLEKLTLERLRNIGDGIALDEECKAVLSAMMFGLEDLPTTSRQSLEHFLTAFSFAPGDINQDFNTTADYNAVHSRPVVAFGDGQYCIPIFPNLPKAIYESPYYWMIDDDQYRDTALSNRGDATESVTHDLLVPIFGRGRVFKEVKIRKGKADITDIDVLAVSGNKAVIAQCKSKKLTIDARRGDGRALRNDFTKAVQDAYDQAIRARRALIEGGCRLSDANGAAISLPNKVDEFYILCVTGDHYPAVITQARIYLKRQDRDPHPILLSIFDLDLVGFYLKDRYEFLYYLRQRSAHATHFVTDSEISLLGFHLRHKLFWDESCHMTGVDRGYAQLVDANFLASRGDWPKSEASGRLFHTWKNEVFDELVEDIKLAASEGSSEISAENLLFFMYDLAGKGADDLIRSVEELKRQTLLDGQEHSVRVPMPRYKRGVTFVSFPEPTHAHQLKLLQRKLKAISLAHKYRSQCRRVDDTRIVRRQPRSIRHLRVHKRSMAARPRNGPMGSRTTRPRNSGAPRREKTQQERELPLRQRKEIQKVPRQMKYHRQPGQGNGRVVQVTIG